MMIMIMIEVVVIVMLMLITLMILEIIIKIVIQTVEGFQIQIYYVKNDLLMEFHTILSVKFLILHLI